MTGNAEKAMHNFNKREEREQIAEAFEARMRLIESIMRLFDIALNENRHQYENMEAAFAANEETYWFDHYVLASDKDEKYYQRGIHYRPAFLLRCSNDESTTPRHQTSITSEMLIAVPVQEGTNVTPTTTIGDIDLQNLSIYVYWSIDDGTKYCYEISAEGVRSAVPNDEVPAVQSLLEHLSMQDFTALDTAAALIARLRQDLRNLQLVPHFSVIVDSTGNELYRQ